MSDLSTASCGGDNRNDNGFSPILIILLLCVCGGDGGLFGGCSKGNNDCGCGGGGLGGILPILLILCLCGGGGSFF